MNGKETCPAAVAPSDFGNPGNSTLFATNFWERRGMGTVEAAALCL